MSMYDMVDTTPEGYSEGEGLSKMFSEDDMSEAFEERDIDVITEEINFYKQQAGMAILEIGKRLVEAKAQLSHGEWLPWLEKKVEFSERSAQQYIRLWKEYGKSATVADLGVRKALVLLALPENERDSFAGETHAVDGAEKTAAEMTVKELEKAVAERNAARQEAEQAKADLYAAREAAREARDHVEALQGELEALKNRPTEVAIEQKDATEEQLAAARQEAEAAAARRVAELERHWSRPAALPRRPRTGRRPPRQRFRMPNVNATARWMPPRATKPRRRPPTSWPLPPATRAWPSSRWCSIRRWKT